MKFQYSLITGVLGTFYIFSDLFHYFKIFFESPWNFRQNDNWYYDILIGKTIVLKKEDTSLNI